MPNPHEMGIEGLNAEEMSDFAGVLDLEDLDAPVRRGRKSSGPRAFSLFRKRTFDYTFLGTGASEAITIHRALPVIPYYYYWLGLRIHNVNIQATPAAFNVWCYQTLPHPQDPQEFTNTSPSMVVSCSGSDSAPSVRVSSNQFFGPYLKVVVDVFQDAGTPPVQLYAELSAVLLARPA